MVTHTIFPRLSWQLSLLYSQPFMNNDKCNTCWQQIYLGANWAAQGPYRVTLKIHLLIDDPPLCTRRHIWFASSDASQDTQEFRFYPWTLPRSVHTFAVLQLHRALRIQHQLGTGSGRNNSWQCAPTYVLKMSPWRCMTCPWTAEWVWQIKDISIWWKHNTLEVSNTWHYSEDQDDIERYELWTSFWTQNTEPCIIWAVRQLVA
jgi:hypothetical protein